jgi:HK97 family phage portal protein
MKKKIRKELPDGNVINITDKTAHLYEQYVNDIQTKDFNLVRDMDLDSGSGLWDAETKMFLDSVTLKGLFFSEDWVYICTDLVARKISSQQLRVMRSFVRDGKYISEPAAAHPVQRMLENPNRWQDYSAFMYVTAVDLCLIGNAITWMGQNKDFLMPVPAESVSLEFDREGKPTAYLVSESSSESTGLQRTSMTKFPLDQIAHTRQPNPSSMLWGLSSFTPLRKAILFNRYTSEYLNNFYLKGATPGIALEMSSDANEHVALRLLRSFENAYTGRRNQRRTLVMPKGVTAKPISHSLADQQLANFIELNREVIINALKIPKHELSLAKSGSLGSEEHKTALKNFWSSTLMPMMKIIAGTMTKNLASKLGPDHYLEFDISDVEVLQESLDAKAKLAKEMLSTKTMNEVRAEVWSLPPVAGGDALPGTPSQYATVPPPVSTETPVTAIQESPLAVGPSTVADETLSTSAPETKDNIPGGVGKAANFIKANKDWFTAREQNLSKGTQAGVEKMQEAALKLMAAMAPAIVNSVRVGLQELSFKAEDPKAEIVSKAELRRRLQKVNASFEEKWTEQQLKYLEAVVDLGYNTQLALPFKLPNEDALAALKVRGAKNRREILEARAMDTFAQMSKTTTDKVLDLVEAGVEEGKSVDKISQDIGSYMRNNADEIGARAMTIARTETLTASSLGQAAAMQDAAKVIPALKKMWINAGDDRVRGNPGGLYAKSEADHWTLQGEVKDWDADFSNGLAFPRDPSGGAGEVINCRCTFITLPAEEMDKIPDNLEADEGT